MAARRLPRLTFQILDTTIDVGNPFSFFAAVVEIKHRRDSIDADAVDVKFAHPVQRARQEEAADLLAAEVEDGGVPLGVKAEPAIRVLVRAIKGSRAPRRDAPLRGSASAILGCF